MKAEKLNDVFYTNLRLEEFKWNKNKRKQNF